MELVTVFTPSFNRGYTLGDLYFSLLNQTQFNFEWLIVDDGSNDNTETVIRDILKNSTPFPIRYYKKNNGGKHTAINYGVKLSKGKLFFIVDSDDTLSKDAIEKLTIWEEQISDKSNFAGISGNKGNPDGSLICETFNGYCVDATNLERERLNILGDRAEAYYTDILKKYPFPVFENEKFIDEGLVWDRIATDGFKLRWYNDIIYFVVQREDGLIAQGNKRYSKNPKGYALYTKQKIKLYSISTKQRRLFEYYFYEAVKDNVSLTEAALLLDTNLIEFAFFHFWQSLKIFIKKHF